MKTIVSSCPRARPDARLSRPYAHECGNREPPGLGFYDVGSVLAAIRGRAPEPISSK